MAVVPRRAAATVLALGIAAAGPWPGAQAATTTVAPVIVEDPADAVDGGPDLRRVEAGQSSDTRLRVKLTLARSFTARDLLAPQAGGPPGSLCVRLWTQGKPAAGDPPDFLACVTARADASALRATVTREGGDGLPVTVGTAQLGRPTDRSVSLRIARTLLGRPATVRFAAEATKPGCARLRCVDLAPDLGTPRTLRLR